MDPYAMRCRAALIWTVALLSSWTINVAAQQASAGDDDTSLKSKLLDFYHTHEEPDQGGGFHLTKHWAVTFGDIIAGEGIAGGLALSQQFRDGSFGQVKAEYSDRACGLLQALYDSPWWFGKRLAFTTRARWMDAPSLDLYRLGADSPLARANFAEREAEASVHILARPTRVLHIEGGAGIERYAIGGGTLPVTEDEALSSIPPLPGLSTRDWFTHPSVQAALDWRKPSSGYATHGTLLLARVDDYQAWHNPYSFVQFKTVAEEAVPTFGGRGVADVWTTEWVSSPSAGSQVPFFLMPTLGAGDYLGGYRLYRFRDRDAAILHGEYRWAVHPNADLVAVYEAGDVAPRLSAFQFGDLKRSLGAGISVHTATESLLKLEVAHSSEGFEMVIDVGFSPGG